MKNLNIILPALIFAASAGCGKNNQRDTDFISIEISDHLLSYPPEPILLSELIESWEIVLLESSDEALTASLAPVITENYIGAFPASSRMPYKLFERKTGRFIAEIARSGRGPGEYSMLASSQIDEDAGRVYLAQRTATEIMAYDLNGNYIREETIPLAYKGRQSRFYIDNEKGMITVFSSSPDDIDSPVAWEQDLKGNVISETNADQGKTPHYNCYSRVQKIGDDFIFSHMQLFRSRQDSLYLYKPGVNTIQPMFSVFGKDISDRPESNPVFCSYACLSNYYMVDLYFAQQTLRGYDMASTHRVFVDKKSGKVRPVHIYNDFLGGISTGKGSLSIYDDYITQTVEPAILKMQFEERLNEPDLSDADRKIIKEWDSRLDENDNLIVMFGKMKER